MGDYQRTRDAESTAMFDFTCQLATLEPPPPDTQQLLAALQGNQPAMDDFMRVLAGMISPAEFFAETNVAQIFAAATARASA